jgi:D-xylose transport system substrate-binding protein
MKRIIRAIIGIGLLLLCSSGCGATESEKIALLLPGNLAHRHEVDLRTAFEATVADACDSCQILYRNANGSVPRQERQAAASLAQEANVLVLKPVQEEYVADTVRKANEAGVPTVDYDSLLLDAKPAVFVSYSDVRTGELQAEALAQRLRMRQRPSGPIVMINGEPGNRNEHLLKHGAHEAFERAGVKIADERFTRFWLPGAAKENMQAAIAALGRRGFSGVYAEGDAIAQGAIAAMRSAHIDPATMSITGRNATLPGLRRILLGTQYMTTYNPIGPEATVAAKLAVGLARGEGIPRKSIDARRYNRAARVPSVLLDPVAVTKANLEQTVLADGYVSVAKLCSGDVAAACRAAGIGEAGLAKGEFVREAKAICRRSRETIVKGGLEKLRAALREGRSKQKAELDEVKELLVPTLEKEIGEIRKLGAPAGDEKQVGAVLTAIQAVTEEAKHDPESFVQASGEYTFGHYREAAKLAARYGLAGCPAG